ncbi:hypothetical protein V2O64_23135 [Verrucomicrobiaceae bacterium 227]
MKTATFILSTGRCGTQWIADTLRSSYSESMVVEHEPLYSKYEPRKAVSRDITKPLNPEVAAHLDRIEKVLETHDYLECGHPLWSSAPLLSRRFEGRVRFVHLVRHPVPLSFSWQRNWAFQDPLLPHLPAKILLSPFDEGMQFPEYRERWDTMRPFEKCLYYWVELNAFALKFHESVAAPWLQLKYEDLFNGDGLAGLLDFLGLPLDHTLESARSVVKDRYRFVVDGLDDWRIIERHEAVMSLATRLGYRLEDLDDERLRRRYLRSV